MINKYQPKRNFPDYKSSIIRSPREEPLMIKYTNSEITGPIFKKEILNNSDNDLTINYSKNSEKPHGQEIFVHGSFDMLEMLIRNRSDILFNR